MFVIMVVDKFQNLQITSERLALLDKITEYEEIISSDASESVKNAAKIDKARVLIEIEKYGSVIKLMNPDSSDEEAVFWAYAQYKMGNIDILREKISKHSPVGARLALAQAEYRFGNIDTALTILTEYSGSKDISEEDADDVLVNLGAIRALGGVVPDENSSRFEDVYNSACAYIARGDFEKALDLLDSAEKLVEDEDDLLNLKLQRATVKAWNNGQGIDELKTYLNENKAASLNDRATPLATIVSNNILAAEFNGGDLYVIHEALKTYDDLDFVSKELNSNQYQILNRNLLKLRAKAGMHTLRAAKKHANRFPSDVEPWVVAQKYNTSYLAFQRFRISRGLYCDALNNKKGRNSLIEPNLRKGYMETALAVATLPEYSELAIKPEESELVEYFSSLQDDDIREAGLCTVGKGPDVDSLFPKIDSLIDGVEVTIDESVYNTPHYSSKKRQARNKRARPASFNSEALPDPERWLPKRDRSSYANKKKKQQQNTQGGVADNVTESSASPASTSAPTSSSSKPKGGKKIKKRGKK